MNIMGQFRGHTLTQSRSQDFQMTNDKPVTFWRLKWRHLKSKCRKKETFAFEENSKTNKINHNNNGLNGSYLAQPADEFKGISEWAKNVGKKAYDIWKMYES